MCAGAGQPSGEHLGGRKIWFPLMCIKHRISYLKLPASPACPQLSRIGLHPSEPRAGPVVFSSASLESRNVKLICLRQALSCLMACLWDTLSKTHALKTRTRPTPMSQGHPGSVSFFDPATVNLLWKSQYRERIDYAKVVSHASRV